MGSSRWVYIKECLYVIERSVVKERRVLSNAASLQSLKECMMHHDALKCCKKYRRVIVKERGVQSRLC